jgi:competence protein ComEC
MRTPKTLLALLFLALCSTNAAQAQMTVHHINVGQADATLLEFEKAAILIDAGGSNTGDNRNRDHLRAYLDDFFQRRSDLNRTIYSLIITHPHVDHTKLLMDVMRRYKVRNLVDNGDTNGGDGLQPLIRARAFIANYNATHQRKIIYNKIDSTDIGPQGYATSWLQQLRTSPSDVDIRFLNASHNCRNENNDSLVVLVTYREATYLITGDAEWEGHEQACVPAIPRMLRRFSNSTLLDVDVYKVGHHGSHNATNREFLQALTPKIAVISAGHHSERDPQPNPSKPKFDAFTFGHPREKAIAELEEFVSDSRTAPPAPFKFYTMEGQFRINENRRIRKAIYCTCWDGDITVAINEAGTEFDVQRHPGQ